MTISAGSSTILVNAVVSASSSSAQSLFGGCTSRFDTPHLSKTFVMWCFTASSLIENCSAISIAKMAKHSSELDELDVEGILAFAERVLPRASDVWIQASLAQRQQLQKLFFPEASGRAELTLDFVPDAIHRRTRASASALYD
jgi:hypothetical protein